MNKIKIKHGDHEIEVEGDDRFIKAQLAEFYENSTCRYTFDNFQD